METVILIENSISRIVTLDDYANLISGKEKKDWPEIWCVACGKIVHQQGLLTATLEFTPRFSHGHKESNTEICPLSSRSKRFNALKDNDKSISSTEASLRRERFLEPDTFRLAYLICRHLRGGQGQLSIKAFTLMVEVADSVEMWRHAWLPDWSVPLMLMLMANHETRSGKHKFYYQIKRIRRTKPIVWDAANVHLVAYWLDSGTQMVAGKQNNSFPHEIPLSHNYVNEKIKLVEPEIANWAEKEKFIHSLGRYRIGLLNKQQLKDA